MACAVFCVTLPAVALTRRDENCRCNCGAPMCRQLCHLDCLRCCKCCVYFGLRVGRRSSSAKTITTDAHCSDDRPHQRRGPAAGRSASCKRSRRRLSASTLLSLLATSANGGSSQLIACSNTALQDPSIELSDTFYT